MHQNFTLTLKRYVLLFLAVLCMDQMYGQAPTIIYQQVIPGLSFPVDVVNAGDGTNRLFIVQQGGVIRVYAPPYIAGSDFLTVSDVGLGGEQGLLSLAFHPDYETNRFFYVYYTNSAGNIEIARYQTMMSNPNLADPGSKAIVLTIPHPVNNNHNGGKLNFGSEPGAMLYFATGDGGGGDDPDENAQDGNSLLGKMLRIAVNTSATPPFYTIPADNPFVGNPAVLDEIWALGLRNPFRWSFDRFTQDMWIGDVGQDQVEEINFRAAGSTASANYGWDCYEGTLPNELTGCLPQSSYVSPVYEYPNPGGGGGAASAVTGGIVYRGTEFLSMVGYYFAADYYSGTVYLIKQNGSVFTTTTQLGLPTSVASFGEGEDGTLYALSQNGNLYKVVSISEPTPVKLISFTLRQANDFNDINWKTASEYNVSHFSIESSTNGINFTEAGRVAPSQQSNGSVYSFRHYTTNEKKLFYRLHTVDNDGTSEYSKVISTILKKDIDPIKLYPPMGSSMLVELNMPFQSLRIVNMYGQVIHRQVPANGTGILYLNTSNWKKGVYILIAENDEARISRKFILQ